LRWTPWLIAITVEAVENFAFQLSPLLKPFVESLGAAVAILFWVKRADIVPDPFVDARILIRYKQMPIADYAAKSWAFPCPMLTVHPHGTAEGQRGAAPIDWVAAITRLCLSASAVAVLAAGGLQALDALVQLKDHAHQRVDVLCGDRH
jgi:hypothetical protein